MAENQAKRVFYFNFTLSTSRIVGQVYNGRNMSIIRYSAIPIYGINSW